MKPYETKKIIEETGMKFYKVAAACSIHPTILSGYVNGKKKLSNH